MRIGIFAKTFPGTSPGPVLAAARAAGFEAVQYNMACSGLPSMPDAIPDDAARAVAEAAAQTGLAIAAVSGTYNMIHPDPAVRERGLTRLETLAAAAPALGTRLITLCTGTRDRDDQWRHHPDNATPQAWADLCAQMAQAIAIAERHDVHLGIEPELSNVISSAPLARRFLSEMASDRLVIVLDPANLFETEAATEREHRIAQAVDLLADRIVMAHAKDRNPDGSFATAGNGVIDFPGFLARLTAAGFNGDLVTHGLEAHEAPQVAAFLRATLAAL